MPSQYVTAPEVYMGTPYGPSADVYSLGRLISYMKYKVGLVPVGTPFFPRLKLESRVIFFLALFFLKREESFCLRSIIFLAGYHHVPMTRLGGGGASRRWIGWRLRASTRTRT